MRRTYHNGVRMTPFVLRVPCTELHTPREQNRERGAMVCIRDGRRGYSRTVPLRTAAHVLVSRTAQRTTRPTGQVPGSVALNGFHRAV